MAKRSKGHVDNLKGALRDILVELMLYCHGHLEINNAEIGLIFRRDRANVKRILDKNKSKRRTAR